MHRSVKEYVKEFLQENDCKGTSILEVGSRNVNGSVREFIELMKPKEYIGIDMLPGRGVDVVGLAENLTTIFGKDRFDIVISTEMLEHCKEWKKSLIEIFFVCKPGGLILLTARAPGFKVHAYPNDYWRFTSEDMEKIFGENHIIDVRRDSMASGVFIKIKKTATEIFVDFEVASINLK
jgi:SAM-dependent methyltransferase